jgi:hypothetical protein
MTPHESALGGGDDGDYNPIGINVNGGFRRRDRLAIDVQYSNLSVLARIAEHNGAADA